MADKILNSFDVWIAAQGWKSKLRLKSIDNISLEGIGALRRLILEFAIRGKLVPQDPTDEPARVLIKKITNEREVLLNQGKIKKVELLNAISEDEKKFNLPHGWEWIRLGAISEFINGYAFKSSDFTSEGAGIIKIGDIQNGQINSSEISRVGDHIVGELDEALKIRKGDLLIAMSGATTGKLGFNKSDEIFYLNQRVGKIVPYLLNKDYTFHYLSTKIAENLTISQGSAIPNLSTAQIKNIVFALPPLAEQHRIVAKVDELMALCDELEQQETNHLKLHQLLVETLLGTLTQAKDAAEFQNAWATLAQHFDDLFITEDSIDQLKQTILQLAVMGKLVSQDPKDEPASVLLERIKKDKERLIEEGEIKDQKPLPVISDDDKPYTIPRHWEFSRLGYATNYGLREQVDPDSIDENEWVLELEDIEKITSNLLQTIYAKDRIPKSSRNRFYKGDVLYGKLRPYLDKVIVANNDGVCTTEMIPLRGYIGITSEYLRLVMKSPYFVSYASESTHGMNLPRLGTDRARLALIPLAPHNEQHRFVAKVDELFSLCDRLKERITESQKVANQMADSILEQVV
jgi:type I restriction enzyme S subunit